MKLPHGTLSMDGNCLCRHCDPPLPASGRNNVNRDPRYYRPKRAWPFSWWKREQLKLT